MNLTAAQALEIARFAQCQLDRPRERTRGGMVLILAADSTRKIHEVLYKPAGESETVAQLEEILDRGARVVGLHTTQLDGMGLVRFTELSSSENASIDSWEQSLSVNRSPEEAKQWARETLSRLLPFDQWVASLEPELKASTAKTFGSLRYFYEQLEKSLREIAGADVN